MKRSLLYSTNYPVYPIYTVAVKTITSIDHTCYGNTYYTYRTILAVTEVYWDSLRNVISWPDDYNLENVEYSEDNDIVYFKKRVYTLVYNGHELDESKASLSYDNSGNVILRIDNPTNSEDTTYFKNNYQDFYKVNGDYYEYLDPNSENYVEPPLLGFESAKIKEQEMTLN